MSEHVFLIACPVFRDELEMVLAHEADVEIHYLSFRIHNNDRQMEEELLEATGLAVESGKKIVILIGNDCHTGQALNRVADKAGAAHPEGKNCIEILLGREKAVELSQNRTSIITPGWVRMFNFAVKEGVRDKVDIRTEMGWFDRLLLVDPGLKPLPDEDILSFFDLVEVPVEFDTLDLENFKREIKDLLKK